jgi:manganese transport protein
MNRQMRDNDALTSAAAAITGGDGRASAGEDYTVAEGLSRSLDYAHGTVLVPHRTGSWWRQMFAFAGPAYMVAVGYMDPGNWATDIEGGARFGYRLIWVLLMSNLMAVLLQTLSARLGIVAGRDLAQACREAYGGAVRWTLFLLCEIAIAACDLAEVLGTAIGLQLLTAQIFGGHGIPLMWAVLITGLDVFLLLAIQRFGIRKMEAFIISLVSIIGLCFIVEIFLSKPSPAGIASGFIPTPLGNGMLYVAIGIIGATVMPHNLYLHSALVQSRNVPRTADGIRHALRFNFYDSVIALNIAFLVNAAILIVAAATFWTKGMVVTDIGEAHQMLHRLLGTKIAPLAFALALICAGQSSTITGTLAGQITMEGFLHFRMRPWLRRLITRSLAIIPAIIVISIKGEGGTMGLLVLSQVILSLQLPFAVVPLVKFTSSRLRMQRFVTPTWMAIAAWLVAAVIIGLNAKMAFDQIIDWSNNAGPHRWAVFATAVPMSAGLCALLLWMTFRADRPPQDAVTVSADDVVNSAMEMARSVRRVGVAVEGAVDDAPMVAEALALARSHRAELVLMHIVEGVGGQWHGSGAGDQEYHLDEKYLNALVARLNLELTGSGAPPARMTLGYGSVAKELVRLAREHKVDLMLVGGHGHRGLNDILRGTTIDAVRHGLRIPILAIRGK